MKENMKSIDFGWEESVATLTSLFFFVLLEFKGIEEIVFLMGIEGNLSLNGGFLGNHLMEWEFLGVF